MSADAGVVVARWWCGSSPDAAMKATRDLATFAARHGPRSDRRLHLPIVVSKVLGCVIDPDGPCLSSIVVDAATDGSSLTVRVTRQGCSVECDDATLHRVRELAERIEWS